MMPSVRRTSSNLLWRRSWLFGMGAAVRRSRFIENAAQIVDLLRRQTGFSYHVGQQGAARASQRLFHETVRRLPERIQQGSLRLVEEAVAHPGGGELTLFDEQAE